MYYKISQLSQYLDVSQADLIRIISNFAEFLTTDSRAVSDTLQQTFSSQDRDILLSIVRLKSEHWEDADIKRFLSQIETFKETESDKGIVKEVDVFIDLDKRPLETRPPPNIRIALPPPPCEPLALD